MITNAQYYRKSFLEADYAFNCWCEECLEHRDSFCRRNDTCAVCHARWYTLPWSKSSHESMMRIAKEEGVLPFPDNDDAENMLRIIGAVKYPPAVEKKRQPRARAHRKARSSEMKATA